MGNVLVHLCPQISTKVVSKYRRMGLQTDRESFTSSYSDEPSASRREEIQQTDQRQQITTSPSSSLFGPKILKEHIEFPFLFDDEISYWILNTRFMFILRGPPGSGKSYITECIKLRYPSAKICSADDFWYLESDGLEYQFDVSRLAEAHQWCHNKARDAAASSISPIVIDNSNVRAWETRYYTDLARNFGYTVIMVTPQTPWRFDPDALSIRNVHFVSYDTVEAKVRNFEHVFPLYYGWLWPGPGSDASEKACCRRNGLSDRVVENRVPMGWPLNETQELLEWAWNTFVTMVGLPDVRVQLTSTLSFPDDAPISEILQHWHSATQPSFGVGLKTSPSAAIPHITARFARFGRAAGAEQYGLSSAVTESLLGRLFTVQVTGLFFSLRSVGLRIRLPADDLVLRHLWGSNDQAVLYTEESMFEGDNQSSPVPSAIARNRPIGCRAHVTLALASDVSAVQTGLDLLRIVDAELDDRPGDHVAIVPGGSIRRVTVRKPPPSSPAAQFHTAPPGYEYMFVCDLDVPQHHRVLYSAVY